MTQYKRRKDANHADITGAFERMGCAVADLSRVGGGVPDLLVSKHGEQVLIEVKTATGKHEESQKKFYRQWKGEIRTVRALDDVLGVVQWLDATALEAP